MRNYLSDDLTTIQALVLYQSNVVAELGEPLYDDNGRLIGVCCMEYFHTMQHLAITYPTYTARISSICARVQVQKLTCTTSNNSRRSWS